MYKRIISVLLMIIIVCSATPIAVSASSNYSQSIIDAVLANEAVWRDDTIWNSDGYYGPNYLQFLDLNFDGNLEFVVTYTGGTMRNISSQVFYFSDGRLVRAGGGDLSDLISSYSATTLTYYYNQKSKSYIIDCQNAPSESSTKASVQKYLLVFDGKDITVDYYSAKIPAYTMSNNSATVKYYDGASAWGNVEGANEISEEKYNKINISVLSDCVNANMVSDVVRSTDWKGKSTSQKRSLLENAYNSFSYDKYNFDQDFELIHYKQYQAKSYINSNLLPDQKMLYTEIEENYSPTQYYLVNLLSFGWQSKFGFSDNSQVWETILLDILLRKGADANSYTSFLDDSLKIEKSLLKYFDKANININDKLTINVLKNIKDSLSNIDLPYSIEDEASFISTFNKAIDGVRTTADFIKDYSNYLSLRENTTEDLKAFLSQMKGTYNYKNIPAFQRALDRIIDNLNVDSGKLFETVLNETISDKVLIKTVNYLVGTVVKLLLGEEVANLIDITKDTTIFLMDTICGTGSIAQANINLYMLDKIDEAASEAYQNCSQRCISSNYTQSYKETIGGYQFFNALYRYGAQECRTWANEITKDILTRLEDTGLLIRKHPGCDKVTEFYNLERNSTEKEKTRYIEDKCNEDEQYSDELDSLPAIIVDNWFKENNSSFDNEKIMVVFNILNFNSSTKKIAKIIQKGERVPFPELPQKNGYITPDAWYIDSSCNTVFNGSSTANQNLELYTKYKPSVYHTLVNDGKGLIINQVLPNNVLSSSQSLAPTGLNGDYTIPAYIDGYRVIELGKDIFSDCKNITSISIPSTIKEIDSTALKSVANDVEFSVVEGSTAEKNLQSSRFTNVKSRSELSFGKNEIVLRTGCSHRIRVAKCGSNEYESLNWNCSNTQIASIRDGIITTNKTGVVTVTAYSDTASTSCQININNIAITGDADYDSIVTVMDASLIQYYLANMADEYDLDLLCSDVNNDKEVGIVDATYIQRYIAGIINGFSLPESVSLNYSSKQMNVGDSITLKGSIIPSQVMYNDLTWESSNKSVATVNNGVVTAKAAGTATITATTHNGKTAKCNITVVPAPNSVTLNSSSISLDVGGTYQLSATVSPSDANDKTVSFNTSNSAVATVDSTGKITAKSSGSATITATTSNGKKASCTVYVNSIEVSSVSLNAYSITLDEQQTYQLSATVYPSNATNKTLTWSTNNSSVATVSSTGKVTAVSGGTANITAKTTNGKSVSCTVTVNEKIMPKSIEVLPEVLTLTVGNTFELNAKITPNNAVDKSVSWSSSNSNAVSVDQNGKLVANKAGMSATITARTVNGLISTVKVDTVEKASQYGSFWGLGVKYDDKIYSAPVSKGPLYVSSSGDDLYFISEIDSEIYIGATLKLYITSGSSGVYDTKSIPVSYSTYDVSAHKGYIPISQYLNTHKGQYIRVYTELVLAKGQVVKPANLGTDDAIYLYMNE